MRFVIFLIAPLFFAFSCALDQGPRRGEEVLERWETSNASFSIRVTSFNEVGGFPSGAYYVFESASGSSNLNWHEIIVFRHDDRIAIPTANIRLQNDRVGYMFIGWKYAVTTDGGRTWNVWDAQKDLENWRCCNYSLIREVTMSDSGDGEMYLNPLPQNRNQVSLLRTEDFGMHWSSN